ncbi:Bug family tripartite tricarboxylate transporter substrate binding protein [Enterovirga rhinocerotis]|uniref:Tripartite-type tricarboxylate transporter receptor subunit TctC n=1 Tax=Enterovirga rhinocerotis TaxID=1339210 RepID=A0A4R7BIU8_9HYPH|nr:tripartite tricarboxylate transporter substrate binding protein [Enterovirga rhinocerotis]TDR85158.1 tripartite-type tricarboxylate transporter receptor subunit TctC [Enterovirga rhinocerotis]
MKRWRVLSAATAAFAALWLGTGAARADYPERTVKIVVPFPAGGTTDILARIVAEGLDRKLGRRFIVENRPGASGNLGSQGVAQSDADGYTLLMGTVNTHGINSSMFKSMPYDAVKDFAPITMVGATPNVMMAHPSLGVSDVAGLIKAARETPGAIDFGSTSTGGSPHMSGELLKMLAEIKLNHVPYRGGAPMLNDLIGGHIKLGFDNLPSAIAHVKAGSVKALAVTTKQRYPSLPDVPTMEEAGIPGYEVNAWFGLFAPAGTPRPVVDKLQRTIAEILAEPAVRARLLEIGAIPGGMSPDEFGAVVRREVERWPEVVARMGLKID